MVLHLCVTYVASKIKECARDQRRTSAGISVGDGAWLGAGAKIFDGVDIGPQAVVGAGAVVRDSVPERATAVGVPARIVGTRA